MRPFKRKVTKVMSAKALTIADYRTMLKDKAAEFIAIGKGYVAADAKIEKLVKEQKESVAVQGKYLCALRELYVSRREQKPMPAEVAGRTVSEFIKTMLGGTPNNHAQSCAHTAQLMIGGGLIEEVNHYDQHVNEALTCTSRILTKANDNLTHPAVLEAAAILNKPGKTALKSLKAILDRFVETGTGEDAKTEFLTAAEMEARQNTIDPLTAAAVTDGLVKSGNLGALLAAIQAIAKTTANEAEAKAIVHAFGTLRACFAENKDGENVRFSKETLNKWVAEASGPIEVTPVTLMLEYGELLKRKEDIEDVLPTETAKAKRAHSKAVAAVA
jgi:hypothetical protein